MIKRFENQNYYELLEIPVSATPFEIRQAYKEALSIYHEDSLTTYAFFGDEERSRILKRIEEAVFTLMDDRKRAEYNRRLLEEGEIDSDSLDRAKEKKTIPLFQRNKSKNRDVFLKKITAKIQERDVKELSEALASKEWISGEDIKRLREAVGAGIDDIYEITRISASILKSIESDQFDKLPPQLYLKNFLKAYAEILQIDPKRFVEGYLKNLQQVQEEPV